LVARSEAEKQQKLNEAEGQKALAEAIQAKGEAEAAAVKAKLEAEAEGLRKKALAEAEGLRQKGLAEAEAINKKAEALAKMNETGKMDMQLEALKALFSQLPAMYEAAAKPWEKVGNITMYSGGKDGGDNLLTGNITKTITQVGAGLKDSLGIDLGDVVKGLVGGKLVGSEVAKALSTKDNA
jgi:flotillin